jgi:tetratricopeptide (TPR) repeat protein
MAHYNLANWLVRLGKYREAAGHYRQSLELNPNDPKIHLNLGLVLIQFLGQPEEGAAHLEKSLELDPDQPQAQHIKDTIAYLKNRR